MAETKIDKYVTLDTFKAYDAKLKTWTKGKYEIPVYSKAEYEENKDNITKGVKFIIREENKDEEGNTTDVSLSFNIKTEDGYEQISSDNKQISFHQSKTDFPTAGKDELIYLDESENLLYRWDGSKYVNVGGDSELGADDIKYDNETSELEATNMQNAIDEIVETSKEFITKDVNNLTNYTLSTDTGTQISAVIDPKTYVMTITLKNAAGDTLGDAQTIDLPLESMIVNGAYDDENKKLILTLNSTDEDGNANVVEVDVKDLIAGLVSEERKIADIDLKDDIDVIELSDAIIPTYTKAEFDTVKESIKIGQRFIIVDDEGEGGGGAGSGEEYVGFGTTKPNIKNGLWIKSDVEMPLYNNTKLTANSVSIRENNSQKYYNELMDYRGNYPDEAHAIFEYNNNLYMIVQRPIDPSKYAFPDTIYIEKYDDATNSWSAITNLSDIDEIAALSDSAKVQTSINCYAINSNILYIFGVLNPYNNTFENAIINLVIKVNLDDGSKEVVRDVLPSSQYTYSGWTYKGCINGFTTYVKDNYIYLFGGHIATPSSADVCMSGNIYKYDCSTDEISYVTSSSNKIGGQGLTFEKDGYLYIFAHMRYSNPKSSYDNNWRINDLYKVNLETFDVELVTTLHTNDPSSVIVGQDAFAYRDSSGSAWRKSYVFEKQRTDDSITVLVYTDYAMYEMVLDFNDFNIVATTSYYAQGLRLSSEGWSCKNGYIVEIDGYMAILGSKYYIGTSGYVDGFYNYLEGNNVVQINKNEGRGIGFIVDKYGRVPYAIIKNDEIVYEQN